MKKALSLGLAVLMLLSCLSVTVLATESDGTWSYDPNTNTFTVNCTIPKKATLNTAIPEEVSITSTDEITGITDLVAIWGKTCEENGYLYDSKMWNAACKGDSTVFEANTEYGYLIVVCYNPSVLQKDLSAAKIVLNGKEYSNVGNAQKTDEYAEMFIAVDFGTLDENGNFIGGDFAETEPGNKSGSTTITATKAEPELEYTIVIPTATTLTEEAHKDVQLGGDSGKASVDVTTDRAKTNIYYTVDLTNATFKNGTNSIATTYAYAQGGEYAELTNNTKVTVYSNKTVKDSTVQVSADETAWQAAPAGTYTASVVFNFGTEEVVTVGDVLATAEKKTPAQPYGFFAWVDDTSGLIFIEKDDGLYLCEAGYNKILPLDFVLSADGDDYKGVNNEYTITFKMTEGKLTSIKEIGITQSTLTFVQTEVATLGDVLDTAEGEFPTSEIGGWTNGTWTMFKDADKNALAIKNEDTTTTFPLTTLLFTTDGGYKYIFTSGTYTLNMEAGHLTSFDAEMQPLAESFFPGIGGHYTSPVVYK